MAEMPDPGALGDTDVAVVSMVRKVKSKLGYTEINTPVDLSQFDDEKVKFGLSEKHTKFEKNLLHGFDKSADLLSKP